MTVLLMATTEGRADRLEGLQTIDYARGTKIHKAKSYIQRVSIIRVYTATASLSCATSIHSPTVWA